MSEPVLKYTTVRRTSAEAKALKRTVNREDLTETEMDLKNLSKKCLTTYHESDKINKLSAAKAEALQDLEN